MPKVAMENLTETMFYVLMAFQRGAMCGIEIVEYLEELTNGRIQIGPATLYTILAKFEKEKMIREIRVEGRKRTYQITDKGNRVYEAEIKRLQICLEDAQKRVDEEICSDERQEENSPLVALSVL